MEILISESDKGAVVFMNPETGSKVRPLIWTEFKDELSDC